MASRLVTILPLFLATLFAPTTYAQAWQGKFAEVESLVESGNVDSAKVLFEDARSAAENQYSRSDSTIEVKFYRDGVSLYRAYRSFADVEQLYSKAVGLSEELYGPQSGELAYRLRELGAVYVTLGRYREAESTFRRALQIARQAFGESSAETVEYLNDLGDILIILARLRDADSAAQEALKIIEKTGQSGNVSEARSLDIKGQVQSHYNAATDAEATFSRSLMIREGELGPDHPDVAISLCLLGRCYRKVDKTADMKVVLDRSLRITEAVFGSDHVETAQRLARLADYYYLVLWQFHQAEEYYARAASILENYYGRQHPSTASAISYLATITSSLTRYSEAETLTEEVLPIIEEAYGELHPEVTSALMTLAAIKRNLNEVNVAMELYKRVLAIWEARGESDVLRAAGAQYKLGSLYLEMKMYTEAEFYLSRAYSVYERSAPSISRAYFGSTLANLYLTVGRIDESADLYAKCWDVIEERYDGKHPLGVSILSVLASCEMYRGNIDRAEQYVNQALELAEEVFGPEDADYALALGAAGDFYTELRQFERAEPLLLQALDVMRKAAGPDHAQSFWALRSLARHYAAREKYEQSLRYFGELLALRHRQIEAVFAATSESERISHLRAFWPFFQEILFLTLAYNTDHSRELSLEMLLKGKGLLEEASMAARNAAYCSHDSTVADMLRQLGRVRTSAANEILSGDPDKEELAELYAEQDSLEVLIGRRCLGFEQDLALRDHKVADVAMTLPEDAVLIQFFDAGVFDFASGWWLEDSTGEEIWKYGALTLNRKGETSIVDLGCDVRIDSLILSIRRMIYEAQPTMYSTKASIAEARLADSTALLRKLIFDPLVEKLEGKKRLFICTDALMNLIPFEILADDNGEYLIEKYRITYLTSGRDLLRYRQDSELSDNVVVLADPDFDNVEAVSIGASSFEVSEPSYVSRLLRGASGCLDGPLGRLSYSLTEGSQVAASFRRRTSRPVAEWYGPDASEGNLKAMETGPGVLHIATHGYVCPDPDDDSAIDENPLIRFGLALAGYNRTVLQKSEPALGGEDGILTAYEVSGLNLNGTELVTLSACESGIEESYVYEGLCGLRRAFQHAGAQTVLTSLWRVPDRETSLLMEGFYERWLSGSSKQDALRDSALELLQRCRRELGCGHPLLWGGFVLTGNPN